VEVPANRQLVITTDMLNTGIHFPENTSPEDIACKSLMVNLSDLAAMGATPAWVTMAIALPEIDEEWLQVFSRQFHDVLSRYNISLIGGDTTRGPLSIAIQAMGLADSDSIMRRDRAEQGDRVYVTGTVGDAGIGLQAILNNIDDHELQPCIHRLNRPEARVAFAEELAAYCRCAIDISDGLVADLGHILSASRCGAEIHLNEIPLSLSARHYFNRYHKSIIDWSMVLTQGDDYELCFTVNSENEYTVNALAKKHGLQVSCIGEINDSDGLLVRNENNVAVNFMSAGFKHF
jgi:thiamine-monophosphate kinase